MKLAKVIAVPILLLPLLGCLWDADTLAYEDKHFPEAVDILTGRIERNPPLYYEMRLERVTKEVASNPGKLEMYDDAGVAEEELGNQDAAIRWMERKKAVLDKLDSSKAEVKEHLYRYHANIGTFYAHRALTKDSGLPDLARGRDHIAAALKINPDAHFGREEVQLKAIEWAISVKKGSTKPLRSEFGSHRNGDEEARGLLGLMVLGSAWESVDVIDAIHRALRIDRGAVSYIAYLRVRELLASGKKSLVNEPEFLVKDPDFPLRAAEYRDSSTIYDSEIKPLEAQFRTLRRAADEYRAHREAFMMERLKAGRHPDTDPNFWKGNMSPNRPDIDLESTLSQGYVEPPRPDLGPEVTLRSWWNVRGTYVMLLGVFTVLGIAIFFVGKLVLRKLRRRHQIPQ